MNDLSFPEWASWEQILWIWAAAGIALLLICIFDAWLSGREQERRQTTRRVSEDLRMTDMHCDERRRVLKVGQATPPNFPGAATTDLRDIQEQFPEFLRRVHDWNQPAAKGVQKDRAAGVVNQKGKTS